MADPEQSDDDDVIAQMRKAIGAIESTSAGLVRPPRQAKTAAGRARSAQGKAPAPIEYPGMPEGDDWLRRLPARYHHGQNGFDRRIAEELAAVGAPCYTLNDLTKIRSVPQGIPIFIDWLTNLEERIPGPETEHRQAIRANLMRNLNDPAARGNSHAIDVLITQLQRRPPLIGSAPGFAARALARIATKKDFPRIARLLDEAPPEVPKGPLIEYLGKVKTSEAREIALHYLDTEWTYFSLKALVAMRASDVRTRIEPHLDDANAMIRRLARRALETLPT